MTTPRDEGTRGAWRTREHPAGRAPGRSYVDVLREHAGPPETRGVDAGRPGARRVLVTDGPFAETREQLG